MSAALTFAVLAANPVGGLLVAVPYALVRLHYPIWLTLLAGVPLAYVQVLVIDATWSLLERSARVQRFLSSQRSPRITRLLAGRGNFRLTFCATPFIGPWLVMGLMRWIGIPQAKVALPILLALLATATATALLTMPCLGR